MAIALVACAPTPSKQPSEDAYPKAYAGSPVSPLEGALDLVHRAVVRAREHGEVIQLACLRDKETKLEALRAERDGVPAAEVDERARRLRSDTERCVGGN